MMPLFRILPTVPTVSLFKLFTEPRIGKVQVKRLEEDSRSQRNCMPFKETWLGVNSKLPIFSSLPHNTNLNLPRVIKIVLK